MIIREYEDIEIAGFRFRINKKRTLWSEGSLAKIFQRDRAIGPSDLIYVSCMIFDKTLGDFRMIMDSDLQLIDNDAGHLLIDKINEFRGQDKPGEAKT